MNANEALEITMGAAGDDTFGKLMEHVHGQIERIADEGERTYYMDAEHIGGLRRAAWPCIERLRDDGFEVSVKRNVYGAFDHAYVSW